METYFEFFRRITGGHEPLWYQLRLRAMEGEPFRAVEIPTGLGKTQAVMVDWLHRRPTRRLVWVLPGRALTRQVVGVARALVEQADASIRVLELMGDSPDNDLTLRPEESAILVGTQDLLVSRALNRGYARTPFRWPMDFGLLNNDTAWVFDEVQLLGDALATSCQMAAFRERFKTFGQCPCVWLSATFDLSWLRTVDFGGHRVAHLSLTDEDKAADALVVRRLGAAKTIAPAGEDCRTPKECATFAAREHRAGTLTLVMANTVDRAREIYMELPAGVEKVLLHSRFRPADRAAKLETVLKGRRGIVVSTQVIEAGVDLDADLLLTDVAPWASMVQRFGRVNRYGDRAESRIYWVDRPLNAKKKEAGPLPYAAEDVERAREILQSLTSAAPGDLERQPAKPPYAFVLRKADLLDLFDTTPDLAGNQMDVSRYVRSGEESDVYVAWREWGRGQPPRNPPLDDRELCAVPLGKELQDFVEKHGAWVWRFTQRGGWEEANGKRLYPGMRLLVRSAAGGYGEDVGWMAVRKGAVAPAPQTDVGKVDVGEQSHDGDPRSRRSVKKTLAEHTDEVCTELEKLIAALGSLVPDQEYEELRRAARRHDWGKAHRVFQQTLHGLKEDLVEAPEVLLAKSDSRQRHSRKFFRHELASALAMLAVGDSDLAAYLAAAHHGKVRVNIRSMPGEVGRKDSEKRVARGVWESDDLFAADLGGGETVPEVAMGLGVTMLGENDGGERSWTDRVLRLLQEYGPFRLAFLEMVLRTADETASALVGGDAAVEEDESDSDEESVAPVLETTGEEVSA